LRLERGLFGRELGFQRGVVGGLDEERRLRRDGTQELFLRCLFEVGEAQLGEEFLWGSVRYNWLARRKFTL
jgi:hypothetical protein